MKHIYEGELDLKNGKMGYEVWFRWLIGIVITAIMASVGFLVSGVIANDRESRNRDDGLNVRINSAYESMAEMRTSIARIESKLDYVVDNMKDIKSENKPIYKKLNNL